MMQEQFVVYLVSWLPYNAHGRCYEGLERDDASLIGVYSTEANAKAAIERSKKLPGFRDYPDSFEINEQIVDGSC